MSLNWSIQKCVNADDLLNKYDDKDNIIAERKDRLGMFLDVLIWSAMGCDLGKITADNIDEWLYRLELRRKMGLYMFGEGKVIITRPILERFIGFEANVCTTTRRSYQARLVRQLTEEIDRDMNKRNQYRGKRK